MGTTIITTRTIDARGMPCPGALMSLISAIREGAVGDAIEVLSSEGRSNAEIPAWVSKAGHELLAKDQLDGYVRFVVRKAR